MVDWAQHWFEFDDAVYLNTSAEGVMPRPAVQAARAAIEAKAFPHRAGHSSSVDVSERLRSAIARLIGGHADEVTLTTGASAGTAVLANALPWQRGDEIITAAGEFPLQYSTWRPLTERHGLVLRVVDRSGQWLSADDLIAALTPRTRLVSVSLVRFDDGSLLDAARLATACHAQETLLCLDVSQACGGMPLDVTLMGADFITSAGYKWLLSPFGTGFFWCRLDHLDTLLPGPFYWRAAESAADLSALRFEQATPVRRASRWDTPEWSGDFNPNLAAMTAAVALVEALGPAVVKAHNDRLIDRMFERLPADMVQIASPRDAAARGPYGCFRAGSAERTKAIFDALIAERMVVSLREGNIRVSPYLFTTDAHIDRLVDVVTAQPAAPAAAR
jgi:selenocysteine lyase/cysteine desulfurase